MDEIDFSLDRATTLLRLAIPNPVAWSGQASNACAELLEGLVAEVQAIRGRH
jgi:hypothetical protein